MIKFAFFFVCCAFLKGGVGFLVRPPVLGLYLGGVLGGIRIREGRILF